MDIKEKMVRSLKNDCDVLLNTKIPMALKNISDEKGVNTYRNLTKALADNIKLIEELEKDDYKPMWSIYETGANEGNLTPQVAVWMQNGKGEISSHQVFDIDYKIKGDTINGVCNVKFEKFITSDMEIKLNSHNKVFSTGERISINNIEYIVIKITTKTDRCEYLLLRIDEYNRIYKS